MSTARTVRLRSITRIRGSGAPTCVVNGLGSQCLNYACRWRDLFCDRGLHVVRFDNRDVGLSSKLDGVDYALVDMADDAIAVLDAMGVERAHVMGARWAA